MFKFELNAKSAAILVLVGAFLSGLVGPLDKMMEGLDYYSITFYRSLITAIILAVIIIVIDKTLFKVKKEHILLFIFLGLAKLGMDAGYLHAIECNISISLATVLQMTAPYFLILFSRLIFKEKITPRKVVAVVMGTIAACLIGNVFTSGGNINVEGVILGLISGMGYATYMMTSTVLIKKEYNVLTVVFWAFIISAICLMPFNPIVQTMEVIVGRADLFIALLLMGAVFTFIPYTIDIYAVKYVNVTVVTVLSMFEIIVAAVVDVFFGVPLTVGCVIGMIILLVSMLIIDDKPKEEKDANSGGPPPEPEKA